jgi:hypothetical protein
MKSARSLKSCPAEQQSRNQKSHVIADAEIVIRP